MGRPKGSVKARRGPKSTNITDRKAYNKHFIERALKYRQSTKYKNLYDSMRRKFSDISEGNLLELKNTDSIRGWGVFAKKFIPAGTEITPYRGVVLSKEEYDKKMARNPFFEYKILVPKYDYGISDRAFNDALSNAALKQEYAIDGSPVAVLRAQIKETDDRDTRVNKRVKCYPIDEIGLAAFINHKCFPACNCDFIFKNVADVQNRIWVKSLRDINPGEELTVDYGFDIVSNNGRNDGRPIEPMKVPKNAITCNCGIPQCRHLDMTPLITETDYSESKRRERIKYYK